jgi:hypothetical protein
MPDEQKRPEAVSRIRRRLRIVSAFISLAFLIVLGGMWVSVYTAPSAPDPADTVMTTPEEVRRYLAAHVPAPGDGSEPPVFIPTGLYIEAIEFNGPYKVDVSGYIWQLYRTICLPALTKASSCPKPHRQRSKRCSGCSRATKN